MYSHKRGQRKGCSERKGEGGGLDGWDSFSFLVANLTSSTSFLFDPGGDGFPSVFSVDEP